MNAGLAMAVKEKGIPGPSAGELRALTGIRGLAAWWVVFYHSRLLLTGIVPAWGIDVMARGYLAVDFFFMLSGFVIGYNYAPKFAERGLAASRLFLWRRFARVWPLHAAILLALVVFVAVLIATGRDHSGYPLHELPLHILLLQNWGFTPGISWNPPAWSISTEAAAYLLFPLLIVGAKWDKRSTGLLVFVSVALLGALHALFSLHGYDRLGADIARLGLARCLIEFSLGTILCVLWRRWGHRRYAAPLAALLALAALGVGLAGSLPETAFVPLALAAALLALAWDKGWIARMLGARVPHWLGEVSYSTYLGHYFLLVLFKIAFVDASLQMGFGQLAGYLLLVLVASGALYYGVEKPGQRWLIGWETWRSHRPASSSRTEAQKPAA